MHPESTPLTTKVCSRCRRDLPGDDFSKDRRRVDGLQRRCKDCDRSYYLANPEQKRAAARSWAQANPERKRLMDAEGHQRRQAERRAAWRSAHPIVDQTCPVCGDVFRTDGSPGSNRLYCGKRCKTRARRLQSHYGLAMAEYHEIMTRQEHRCAICGEPITIFESHVDHCHENDVVRGILCLRCNVGLGHFRDDIGLLEKAISYLGE